VGLAGAKANDHFDPAHVPGCRWRRGALSPARRDQIMRDAICVDTPAGNVLENPFM
jgi:hypothetical protein